MAIAGILLVASTGRLGAKAFPPSAARSTVQEPLRQMIFTSRLTIRFGDCLNVISLRDRAR